MYIIKQLRRKKNISQTDLGKEIGVSLRTIQLYEKKDANIPIKNLSKIAAFFDMTIAELYMQEVNESEGTYAKQKPFSHFGNICYTLDHGKFLVRAPLYFLEDQKEYAEKLADNSQKDRKISAGFVVDSLEDGNHKAFEIAGDSMDDGSIEAIPNKAIVLGLKYNKNKLVRQEDIKKSDAWILVLKNRIICKSITGIDATKTKIQCHNLNTSPEYTDFEIALDDLQEIYLVIKRQF
ncbi:helix-turn-helix domain-containing protein [Flagellimonas allohymeniacidonis]|uniref:XRE family transcriptional regulator n=1 Tax=Flagellimonas allohymeniacidonis TaxID=2517819 RepID=A0A4Q8QGH7_9FLAO|nr:helix-turn-helix transcriptional regulator [Allomuricauda hymeniacidonis]TAI47479.1 XRE family transcriptional regulator [Allomuricauda hymeniacidonis]